MLLHHHPRPVPKNGRHSGQPHRVPLSGEWFTCHGTAESLGWFRKEENREIAAKLWEAFSSWIENGHNDFDDENTIILRVKVTDRVLYSQGRRFEQ